MLRWMLQGKRGSSADQSNCRTVSYGNQAHLILVYILRSQGLLSSDIRCRPLLVIEGMRTE